MGKMKGEIYKYYMLKFSANDPANSSPRLPKYQCRFCNKQYVQNATKMRHHVLNMCEEIPAPLKLALLDIPNIHDDSNDDTKEFLNSIGVGSSSSPDASSPKVANRFTSKQLPKKRKSVSTPYSLPQQKATTALLGTNMFSSNNVSSASTVDNDEESLSVLLCRAILASGSSPSLLENPYWNDVFQRISCPSCKISPIETPLPTKQVIMKDFLDQEYMKHRQENEKQITSAKCVSLQCEVWNNNRDESMLTIVVNTPSPVSYKTFLIGDSNQDEPTILTNNVMQTIRGIGELKVLSLVCKTSSPLTKIWTQVKSEFPHILTFGCVVEALNSLLVSILENNMVAEVIQTFTTICRNVKHSSSAKSKFDQIQRQSSGKVQKLYLPSRSNWISYVVFLKFVQNIQPSLKWLAVDEESRQLVTGDELHQLISDEIWAKVDVLCKILTPVVKWLNHMKKKPEIYLVPKAFAECKRIFESTFEENLIWHDTLYNEFLDCLSKAKAQCMQSVHLSANLLDPIEQGSCLTQEEILQATEFIDNFCDIHDLDAGTVVTELSQFRMKTDFYSKNFLWKVTENVQGSMWWNTMAPKTHLAQVAAALLNIAPAAFSMDDSEESGNSNSLIDSHDCKYIYVAHNLRISSRALSDSRRLKRPRHTDKKSFSNGCDLNSLDIMYILSDSDSEMEEETDELKEMNTDDIV